ncbi:hypothetical protein WI902_28905, partial [Salmonella enterica subsp. enterica serovar Corvallis]
GAAAAGLLCMFLYQWCEERRSLRCPSENKQASESKSTRKIKIAFQFVTRGVLTQAERKKLKPFMRQLLRVCWRKNVLHLKKLLQNR